MATNGEYLDRVCSDCKELAIDILSKDTKGNDRWRTIHSRNATLSYKNQHLNGTIAVLQQSAARCQMCSLIYNKLGEVEGIKSASQYHIFVWENVPDKCKLQIAIGDVNIFTKHVSQWERPKELAFFGQFTSTPTLPILGNNTMNGNGAVTGLAYLPHQDPGCPEAFQQAREWLLECYNHPECSRPPSKLPKRVLDLARLDSENKVSLCLTNGEMEPQRYAALSYSWGETDRLVTNSGGQPPNGYTQSPADYAVIRRKAVAQPGKARPVLEFEAEYRADDIPLSAFPKTQSDALHIAKSLGFRYIWVDSLCILQNDKADWADQGAAMTEIYGRTALVISATSTKTSTQGILQNLQNNGVGIGTWQHRGASNKSLEIFVGDPVEPLDLEDKFLSTRGWVFQERLLSAATLHYTDEGMVWECAQKISLGHHQSVIKYPWKGNWRKLMRQASLDPSDEAVSAALGMNKNEIWYEWINAYSQRDLYDNGDKFPAIAGLAKTFADVFRQEYVAGLWKDTFIEGLLWRRNNRTETLKRFRDKYVAPSWSWASVKGRLEYRSAKLMDSPKKGPILKVLEYNVAEKYPKTYGKIQEGGTILVEGVLQQITVDRQIHPGVRQRDYQECGVSKGFVNGENILCMLDEYDPSADREYPCWCLRIGSHNRYGREADVFLLLKKRDESTNVFSRVGFAEADAWFDVMSPTPNSGVFETTSVPAKLTIE
jgi:hypothetical protein